MNQKREKPVNTVLVSVSKTWQGVYNLGPCPGNKWFCSLTWHTPNLGDNKPFLAQNTAQNETPVVDSLWKMGVDCFGFFQIHCYPEIREHMVRMYKTAEFYGSTSQLLSNKTKVIAFNVFRLVCAFLDFQNEKVGKVLEGFLKCDSKTYPCTAAGNSKEGFGISASWILFCLGRCHHCTFIHRKSPSFFGIGSNRAEWGPKYRKRQKPSTQV